MISTGNRLIRGVKDELIMFGGDMSWAPDYRNSLHEIIQNGKKVTIVFRDGVAEKVKMNAEMLKSLGATMWPLRDDLIDFRGPVPFTVSPLILDSKSVVVVRNGTITNLDQPLDGITWVNVQFQHSRIRLNGGPITLVNVSFDKDCELLWLMLGQAGFELKEKITNANGQPITFAFQGTRDQTQNPE